MENSRIVVLSPQGEMRRPCMRDATGLGEGTRLEMSLESSQGGRGKARKGQVGYSTYMQVMVVLLDTTQNQKE